MKLPAPNFDLHLALNSGQLFNWREHNSYFYLPHAQNVLKLRKNNAFLEYGVIAGKQNKNISNSSKNKIVEKLFNFNRDYAAETAHLTHHAPLAQSIRQCKGLTITRQEPWECLLSFILTQNSNIPRIRQNLLDLSARYGEKVYADGTKFNLFPTPEKLAKAKLSGLQKLKLGYRAEYVSSVAKSIAENGFDLQAIGRKDFDGAKETIMELDGIGPKVGECVLLFGYGFEQAFPIDTWLRQIMQKHYFGGERARQATDKRIGELAGREFGEKAGIVHEYFFANRQNLV